jgi:hypothetical protein
VSKRTINPAITILIRLTNHLIDLIVGQLLANGGHDVTQLCSRDETVVVTVKDLFGC